MVSLQVTKTGQNPGVLRLLMVLIVYCWWKYINAIY